MNYQKLYTQLIESAKDNREGYLERHHILPKCLGGDDSKENIVLLTARQHFLAHWLLYKLHRTTSLAHAWHSMCRVGKGQDERRVNAKHFSRAREAHAMVMSKEMRGANNRFYGKRHTEETKAKIREKRLARPTSEATRKKMSKTRLGVKKTEEHKKKIGEGNKNRMVLRNTSTGETIKISVDERDSYPAPLWRTPFSIASDSHPLITCPYCQKQSTNRPNMNRWHFDNCKEKK